MNTKPTDIRDAYALREMGMPLNTPAIDAGELPAPCCKAIEAGFKAAGKFRDAICAYAKKQSRKNFAALESAFNSFMAKTAVPDDGTRESQISAAILASEFLSIREQWSEVFARREAGETSFYPSGIWPWEPTEATKRRQRNPGF